MLLVTHLCQSSMSPVVRTDGPWSGCQILTLKYFTWSLLQAQYLQSHATSHITSMAHATYSNQENHSTSSTCSSWSPATSSENYISRGFVETACCFPCHDFVCISAHIYVNILLILDLKLDECTKQTGAELASDEQCMKSYPRLIYPPQFQCPATYDLWMQHCLFFPLGHLL